MLKDREWKSSPPLEGFTACMAMSKSTSDNVWRWIMPLMMSASADSPADPLRACLTPSLYDAIALLLTAPVASMLEAHSGLTSEQGHQLVQAIATPGAMQTLKPWSDPWDELKSFD